MSDMYLAYKEYLMSVSSNVTEKVADQMIERFGNYILSMSNYEAQTAFMGKLVLTYQEGLIDGIRSTKFPEWLAGDQYV